MYVKIRKVGCTNTEEDLTLTVSKKTKVEDLRKMIFDELQIEVNQQKLLYKGKILSDENELYEYNIQLNDVIQLMISKDGWAKPKPSIPKPMQKAKKMDDSGPSTSATATCSNYKDTTSIYYKVGDRIDLKDLNGAWVEGKIVRITVNQSHTEKKPPSQEPDVVFKCTADGECPPGVIDLTFDEIRPRSYYKYKPSELDEGMTVLVNYNIDEPNTRGYWYDFKITSLFLRPKIKGTLYIADNTTIDVTLRFQEDCLRIEYPRLLANRDSHESQDFLDKLPRRVVALNCVECEDDPSKKCGECGCQVCKGKHNVNMILLCDECDRGYHISCLTPPLTEIPSDDDWYCPDCKTDENEIVKDGDKLKVSNKKAKMPSATNTGRDWGRGMACVGRTKECKIVSKDHVGEVPGVEVGTCWLYRFQVSEAGIHRPLVAGIHGRESKCAYSLVLSGGYEDDVDNGDEFYYTGSGGRDLSGNKRVSDQSSDQTLTRMNKALAMNCNAKFNAKDGAEAKDWKGGIPVRVVRNFKAAKHSAYSPKSGNRYDGIYKVVKYYPEKGKSGFIVWRYLLRRDDPNPAPWHPDGKELDIINPDGYLEAQKQKEESKEAKKKQGKKRVLKDTTNEETVVKKGKTEGYKIPKEIEDRIKNDIKNVKCWEECKELLNDGKAKFLAKVEELFICVVCQDVVCSPVTTDCKHNVCKTCLQRSFQAQYYNCPYCRSEMGEDFKIKINEDLRQILLLLFPGYDSGR